VTAPLFIFLLSGFAMIIVSFLRRNFLLSAIITGVFALAIAIFSIFIPIDQALDVLGLSMRFDSRWIILGRSFLLNANNRASVGFIFLSGGLILLGAWTAKPERMFFPLGIGTLTLVAVSLMIEPFLFAAIFIELAAITASIMLSSRKYGKKRGGLRLLVLYTMAMLAILLVGWILDVNQQEFDKGGFNIQAAYLLGFGFAVLLSIPPFHSWIPIASGDNHSFSWSFIFIVLQSAGFFFTIRFITGYVGLNENLSIYETLRTVGSTMAIVGAIWAMVQVDLRKIASYALIADMGVMLIAFGIGTKEGLQLALILTIARVISVGCLSQGLNKLPFYVSGKPHSNMEIEQNPSELNVAAMLVGLFSLAGLPLTAGFPGRWGVIGIIASLDQYAWIALLSSMIILGYTTFRIAGSLFKSLDRSVKQKSERTEKVFLWAGILLTLIVGFLPQVIFPWILKIMEGIA